MGPKAGDREGPKGLLKGDNRVLGGLGGPQWGQGGPGLRGARGVFEFQGEHARVPQSGLEYTVKVRRKDRMKDSKKKRQMVSDFLCPTGFIKIEILS